MLGRSVAVLKWCVNKGLMKKVAFEPRPEVGGDAHPYVDIWGRHSLENS